MSDVQTTKATDPLLVLLSRFSESQVEHGRKLDGSKDEIHEVRRAIDVMNARLEPMASLPARLSVIETTAARHGDKLTLLEQLCAESAIRLKDLEHTDSQRKGLSGPIGKVAIGVATGVMVIVLGAILAMVGMRNVTAGEQPTDRTTEEPQT